MAKNERKYTKYKGPQRGNPMWRDPAHTKGDGCAVVVIAALGAVTAIGTGVAVLLG